MQDASDDLYRPDAWRSDVVAALRRRRDTLVRDLAAVFPGEVPLELEPASWAALADAMLAAVIFTVQSGSIEPRSVALHPIERFARSGAGSRHVFTCLHLTERMVLGVLGEEPGLDDAPTTANQVAELVRGASFAILASLFERLPPVSGAAVIRDPLTTLLIRPVFDLVLMQEVVRAQRHQHPLSLILFEVDDLAQINTQYGYGVGDRVLERMGILVRRFFRTHDWVARHGADSIAVLLPETALEAAVDLANRVRTMVEQRLGFVDYNANREVTVTLSAAALGGDALEDELDPYHVMAEAERAVRRARMGGPNRVERVALLPTSVSLLGAASLLDCSLFTIRRLVREGRLMAERHGRHYQIPRAALERYRRGATFEPPPDRS